MRMMQKDKSKARSKNSSEMVVLKARDYTYAASVCLHKLQFLVKTHRCMLRILVQCLVLLKPVILVCAMATSIFYSY